VRRRILLLLATAAVAAGIGSWLVFRGGGGRHDPTPSAYLAQVSSICRGFARLLAQVPGPSDLAAYGEVESSLSAALPLMRAQSAAMESVRAPGTLQPRLKRLFALSHRSLVDLTQALAAARRRDLGAMGRGLVESARLRAREHDLAVAIGIRCNVD
jgi:hypothetical protein